MHVTRFIDSCTAGNFASDRVGSVFLDKAQQIQKCPLSENAQQETALNEILLVEERFQRSLRGSGTELKASAVGQSPLDEHLSVARFVADLGGKEKYGLRKMRMDAGDPFGRDIKRRIFVFRQERHELADRAL